MRRDKKFKISSRKLVNTVKHDPLMKRNVHAYIPYTTNLQIRASSRLALHCHLIRGILTIPALDLNSKKELTNSLTGVREKY